MSEYLDFADVYDLLMDDFDYPSWADYYLRLLERAGFAGGSIVECGCGTGSLSVEFARRGASVLGVDLSERMLEKAAEKARRAGVPLRLVRQDMARLAVGHPADAVVAACDCVNYLKTERSARAFFASAHGALKPGGALAFDVSTRHKLEGEMSGAFFFEEREEVVYLWKNSPGPRPHTLEMDITFFVKTPSGLFRRFEELHTQRAHSQAELTGWLAEAGFSGVECFGGQTFGSPGADERRIHFIAKKADC